MISTKIFDKRDSFNFQIVKFPNLTGNIPLKSSYGVFVGELVRYARACTKLADFKQRVLTLTTKLKTQAYKDRILKKVFREFCDSHILLIQKYTSDVLHILK